MQATTSGPSYIFWKWMNRDKVDRNICCLKTWPRDRSPFSAGCRAQDWGFVVNKPRTLRMNKREMGACGGCICFPCWGKSLQPIHSYTCCCNSYMLPKTSVCVHIYFSKHIHAWMCACLCAYAFVWVCMCLYVSVCMYVCCVDIWVCMHTYLHFMCLCVHVCVRGSS